LAPTIRLLVADGSRIHTQLLAEALRRDPELIVSAFELGSDNLASAVRNRHADVLVLSSTLDEQPGRGFEALRRIRCSTPRIRAVMLLDSSSDEAALSAFRAGARGIVSRTEPISTLNGCIRRVHDGYIWANERQLTVAIEALAAAPMVRAVNAKGISLLSPRELQIVRSLAEGLTNREIAARLKLSQHTVKNYLFRVFDKLGVSSRVELLFMTLADSGGPSAPKPRENGGSGDQYGLLLRAAESPRTPLQLAAARMCASLQKEPRDLTQAYAWYLLAAHHGLHLKEQMGRSMTVRQVEEAQKQARVWLARSPATMPLPEARPAPKPPRRADPSPSSPGGKQNERAKTAYRV
jgi:DNA-binding NarL/FixJ family response regulator